MDEIGLNIRESIVKLLTPEMVKDADKIIVMAEKETWPDYLKESNKKVLPILLVIIAIALNL